MAGALLQVSMINAVKQTQTDFAVTGEFNCNGQGRLLTLAKPMVLPDAIDRIQEHLSTAGVQVAAAENHSAGVPIRTIALCPGAGAEVVGGVEADLLWTGEMRHHDVLEAVESGRSVVLCGHTNTERGYLSVLGEKLLAALPDVTVHVSAVDRDPLSPN